MRILIIGSIVFVIWSVFSIWLNINKLRPAMKEQVTEQTIPDQHQAMPDTLVLADTVKQPKVVIPDDMIVYFKFDDSRFNPDQKDYEHAIEFKTWLNQNSESSLSITGHTDYIGTEAYNQSLGMRRAGAIQDFLIRQGIDANMINTQSKGENEPIADNSSDEGRKKNRRAVITVYN